jgi:hypothetical protein
MEPRVISDTTSVAGRALDPPLHPSGDFLDRARETGAERLLHYHVQGL